MRYGNSLPGELPFVFLGLVFLWEENQNPISSSRRNFSPGYCKEASFRFSLAVSGKESSEWERRPGKQVFHLIFQRRLQRSLCQRGTRCSEDYKNVQNFLWLQRTSSLARRQKYQRESSWHSKSFEGRYLFTGFTFPVPITLPDT